MPSKGIRTLWEKVTGDRQQHVSETADRNREPDLAMLLTTVELSLDDPANKLSAGKTEDLHIRSVLQRVRQELVEYPVVTTEDMLEIDQVVKYILNELRYAVERGYETSAHWSTVALILATDALYIPIPVNSWEYSNALMEERHKYARNLKLLVQNALHYDEYTAELAAHTHRYEMKKKEVQALSHKIQAITDSPEGPMLLTDIRSNADDPARMRPAARELLNKMREQTLLEGDLQATSLSINTSAEQQHLHAQHISQIRNIVAIFPQVGDPKLAVRNQMAAEVYADTLRNRLIRAEAALKPIDANLSELINLGSHAIFQKGTAEDLDRYAEEQLRKFKEMEAQLEATRSAIREKKQAKLLKEIERSLAEEMARLAREETAEEDDPSNDRTDHSTSAP